MFNEITPKKSLQEAFDRLTEYEKGFIQHLRDSFIIEQKLDPSKREYSQRVLVSYSSVNMEKVLEYLASYFDIFGYRVNFYIICGYSRDIMNITIHKTVKSRDIDFINSSPLDIIKLEEERNKEEYDYTIETAEEDEEEETTNFRLMTAEEAKEKYNKLLANNKSDIELHLSKINDAIEDAIRGGSRIVTYDLGVVTNFEVTKVVKRLKKYGYNVNSDPNDHDFEKCIIIIEF